LIPKTRAERAWLAGAFVLASAFAAIDALVGGAALPYGLLILPPLLMAARSSARTTALVAAYSLALALFLGIPDEISDTVDYLLRVLMVATGGALAVWIASLRQRAEETESRSAFLAKASRRLDASLDYKGVAQILTRLLVREFADWCAVYALARDNAIELLAVAHRDPSKETIAWELDRRYPFRVDQPLGVAAVIRTGTPELTRDVTDVQIDAIAYDEEHARMVRDLGLRSAIFIPLRARGRTLGAMAFATAESERVFNESDLDLASELAERAALALDNASLYTHLSEAEVELRQSADELEAVLQGVGSAITVQDQLGRLVFANQAAADLLGFSSIEAVLEAGTAKIMDRFELFDESGDRFSVDQLPGRIALTGERPEDAILRFRDKVSGGVRWARVKATPIFNEAGQTALAINIFDDVTKEKRDEIAERFLSESSSLLVASIDYQSTLDNVAHLAVPQFADWCSVEVIDERGAIKPVALAHVDPSKIELAEELRLSYPVDSSASSGVPNVIRTRQPELYREVPDERLEESAQDQRHLELLRAIGLRSVIIAPMAVAGRAIGALVFCTAESGRHFEEHDLEVATELGRRAAAAVENARLYTERTHIARTLQRSLLPPVLPDIPGIEIAARFRPAGEGYEVGGDFYDVFNTGAGGWALVIGDVCGKGPEAAALTGLARHTLRVAAMQEDLPSKILQLLSEAIIRQSSDSEFCTAAYARLELRSVGASLTLASGGHPLPLLLRGDGGVEQVGVPGTLLGSLPDAQLVDQHLDLRPGTSLVFYTDGVIEAGRPRGAFGLDGLRAVIASCSGLGAQEIAERIDKAVTGLEPNPSDDVAVLVLRVKE
jgi:PAS domain S-box-containing protein